MKFTHQLKFNSVPEWREHYVQYAHLKKYIYALAKREADAQKYGAPHGDEEGLQQALLPGGQQGPTEEGFQRELDAQLAETLRFFSVKEDDILSKLAALQHEIDSVEIHIPGRDEARAISGSRAASQSVLNLAGRVERAETDEAWQQVRAVYWLQPPEGRKRAVAEARKKMKDTFQELYISLHDLLEFLRLNKEGFRKIVKKHDKLTRTVELRKKWWDGRAELQVSPEPKRKQLDAALKLLTASYAAVYTGGKTADAERELNEKLRENVTVERNTVWRDMAAMERKYTSISVKAQGGKLRWGDHHLRMVKLAFSVAAFLALVHFPVWPGPDGAPKSNCLAVLVFASLLWSLEAVPLFVTSMALPLLVVTMGLLVDNSKEPPQRLTPQQSAPAIFHVMFSQTIMLLLGGFAIAAALSKHAIAKQMAVAVLSRVGRKPRNVLLACMFTATFMSMWISNVAAPVLCFGLINPILRTLDPGHPMAKALVMGIALASNVGGMTSPISSPQNIFAIERMSMDGNAPSWLAWFAVALPVAIVCNLICWVLLLLVYRPGRTIAEVRPIKPNTDPINGTQIYITVVSMLTVAAWCANSSLQRYTGEMGVIAILPLVAFFGFDVLNKDDFNSFLWNVVMLAMGGLALGEAVKSSGLLAQLALLIKLKVAALDLWQVALVFCGMVLVATTFISHTVGAMVILPIVQSVGEAMPGRPHPKLLVMAAALMCSGAMGLPVSGFPNMNAVSLEDSTGNQIVNTVDFLMVGVPSSIFAYGVIATLGYALMMLVGF